MNSSQIVQQNIIVQRKEVQFSPDCRLSFISDQLNAEERKSLWYTQQDFEEFKRSNRSVGRDIRERRSLLENFGEGIIDPLRIFEYESNLDDDVTRGVEQFCCAAYFALRKIKKQKFVQAILDEQSKQRLSNIHDPDAIARVGRMHSRPAEELALKLGQHDAKFVDQLGWMEHAKKHWERVIPKQFKTQSSTCFKAMSRCAALSRHNWHERGTIKISVE